MDRRKALKNIGMGFGAMTITPTVVSLMQSCQTAPQAMPVFFSNEQFSILAELMELIIPTTEIPGAIELKLPEFVDAYIPAVLSEERQNEAKSGMEAFVSAALQASGKSSASKLSTQDLDTQLAHYLKSDETPQGEEKASDFAFQLRSLTVNAFRTNEFIGEQVMAYDPIPGRQQGCVDLMETTGGKAWSL
jgi:hypothetical protein